MTDRRSPFRKLAEALVGLAVSKAREELLDIHGLRRLLRTTLAQTLRSNVVGLGKRPRDVWYAAVRAVTGGGVRDLVDPRQEPLALDVGPRLRRKRSRKASP